MHFFLFSVMLYYIISVIFGALLHLMPIIFSGYSVLSYFERVCLMNLKPTVLKSPAQLARKLWDGILKSMLQHMPEQFLPLLNHVFGKKYPNDAPIELLSAEYSAPGKSNPGTLSSIFADIVLRVAGTDIYHLEGQMEKETLLSFRMFEYDTHIALLYGSSDKRTLSNDIGADADCTTPILHFPASIILYLDNNHTVSGQNCCKLVLSDNTETLYTVSVVKIQDYSLKQIRENHLTLFLPFTLLRFRPRLCSVKNPLTKKELTMFVNKIIIILKEELNQNNITQRQYKDYINYLRDAASQIFIHHTELCEEVMDMLTDIVPSYSALEDQLTEWITAKVTREVTAKVTDEVTAKVTDEVTAKVTDEVTAKISTEFQKQLQEETALFTLQLQKKESQLSAANSENARLRALLRRLFQVLCKLKN